MKKNCLLKVMLSVILLVMVLTFLIPSTTGVKNYVPVGTVVLNMVQSFAYFTDPILLILLIGGFYGVLNKTGGYKKLLDSIVVKYKDNRNFIIFTIVLFALVSALTGISLPLLAFVPFVISIILLMGYDKLVALSSTIGAILVGLLGGLFNSFNDPSYGSVTNMEMMLGLDFGSNLLYKILLLLLSLGLLVLYVIKHIKKVNEKAVKYDIKDDTDILITEVKGSYKSIKTWPIIMVFGLLLVILVLGLVPWNSLFKVEAFANFHTWLTGITIPEFKLFGMTFHEFPVFNNLVSGMFAPFGEWTSTTYGNVGNHLMTMNLIIVLTVLLCICSRVKFDDAIEGFVSGVKKMVPTALLVSLAYVVLVTSFNRGFVESIIKWAMELVGGFNIIVVSLLSIIGTLFSVDFFYAVVGVFTTITGYVEDTSVMPLLDVIYQAIYYLVMLVGPTSVMLIFGLSYLNVSYKEWLKYIWRLILELFILIIVILCLMLLLI